MDFAEKNTVKDRDAIRLQASPTANSAMPLFLLVSPVEPGRGASGVKDGHSTASKSVRWLLGIA
jgi:hypothetical protein